MSRIACIATVGIFALCVPEIASADVFAYVNAYSPTTAEYTPGSAFSRNSVSGVNTIKRVGEGQYLVNFGGFPNVFGGNVQVAAYGEDDNYCNLWWLNESGDAKTATIVCFDRSGEFADTKFTAAFTHYYEHQDEVGYALVDYPEGWSHDESADLNETVYNSTGQRLGYARFAPGLYGVNFFGQQGSAPSFRVTTYGFFGNARCRLGGSGASLAIVVCTAPNGQRVDSGFSLTYEDDIIWNSTLDGHLWSTSAGVTSNIYSSTILEGVPTVSPTGTGTYEVRFPGLGGNTTRGVPFASAMDSGINSRHCKVKSWRRDGRTLVADVRCFFAATHTLPNGTTLPAGTPSNTAFAFTFLR